MLGNDRIEQCLRIECGSWRTERITDKISGAVWDGESPWQRSPMLAEGEAARPRFEQRFVDDRLGIAPHLRVELALESAQSCLRLVYMIFPGIPFIYCQAWVEGAVSAGAEVAEMPDSGATGIERQPGVRPPLLADLCSQDTLVCVPLGRRHLELETVRLYDKTDRNDVLVEREKTYVYARGRLERVGNVFCVNDYPCGDSLMLVKHGPTESSALNRRRPDLFVRGNKYAMLNGSGVDYANLPEGAVPCYGCALGVGRTDAIWDEFMRYSEAFHGTRTKPSLFIMSNTWGDRSQDSRVCEQFMLGEIERAHELGVDIVQIDDGWQQGATINSKQGKNGVWEGYYASDPNFWRVNPERFPKDLYPVVARAHEYGIDIGLWFSPDSSHEFANVDRDIDTLLGLHERYGVRYFKMDGIKVRSKQGERRLIHLLETVAARSGGAIQFNMDVTSEDRFGYLYQQHIGTLFVENRYTDWGNYYPHNTFRNLWDLTGIMPARRLQMELLNNRRNADKYEGMPFAPGNYGIDYLFGTVMVANPLVWMELTGLTEDDKAALRRVIAAYKPYQAELYTSKVMPIGQRPNGMRFSGFQCVTAGSCHMMLFREETSETDYVFKLSTSIAGMEVAELYSSASVVWAVCGGDVRVSFAQPRSFVWLRGEWA